MFIAYMHMLSILVITEIISIIDINVFYSEDYLNKIMSLT